MIPQARSAYVDASITTATPARLLVMLVDRLVLDVRRGQTAQAAGDLQQAHTQLVHAQEIVLELRSSLRPDLFPGGPGLISLYDYLHKQLVLANVRKDEALTAHCLHLVEQLAETWREAALAAATPSATPATGLTA